MSKQSKALAAAMAAFGAALVAVYLGTADGLVLQDAVGPLGVAFVTWMGTWVAPANA